MTRERGEGRAMTSEATTERCLARDPDRSPCGRYQTHADGFCDDHHDLAMRIQLPAIYGPPTTTVDGKEREDENMSAYGNNTDGWIVPLDETRAVRFVATGEPITAAVRGYVWATTDNESEAAAITQRRLDEGENASYAETDSFLYGGFPIATSFRYAVLIFNPDRGEVITFA